MHKNTI